MGLPPSSHDQMLLFLYDQFIQNFLRSKFQQNKKFTSIQGTYNRTQQEKNKMKQSFCSVTLLEKVTFQLLWWLINLLICFVWMSGNSSKWSLQLNGKLKMMILIACSAIILEYAGFDIQFNNEEDNRNFDHVYLMELMNKKIVYTSLLFMNSIRQTWSIKLLSYSLCSVILKIFVNLYTSIPISWLPLLNALQNILKGD